ncbi:MAG TPA: type II secretion system F family protein [Chloroflexota bacterium]|nr:type II secretion system F family protein [Chloroflexota bacterium]
MTIFLVTLIAGAGIALIFLGAYQYVSAAVDVIELRLGRYAGLAPADIREQVAKKGTTVATVINRFVDRQNFADRLRGDLQRANLKFTPGEFVVLRGAGVVVGIVAGYFVFHTPFIAVPMGIAGYFVPGIWLKRRLKMRERKFGQLLGEAVMMMSSSLRAGYSMMQALETVSREMAEPICDEFHRVTLEVGVGISVEDALNHMARRIKSTDLELMTIAMNVQREVGGNLAEILDTIAATIRERQELQGEVRSLTAQGRISAYIISGLPVVLAIALYFLNPKYISTLWTTSIGYVMLGVAVTMIVVGFFVTRKVASVEV